jgi:eukaryotic-like serine/threonine-protein kinase
MSVVASRVSQTTIGEYLILEKIGKGAQGTVYKGQHARTQQIVAIKVIPAEVVADSVKRLRFAQECQVSSQLTHPHIVRMLDYGLDGTKPYLVMEYVAGEDLGQRLDRVGKIPVPDAVRWIVQTGQALQWAHERKMIHRDVKPDNILITSDGRAKLADLGLAKKTDGDLNLTRTMSCLGTPNFMAPEQFEDAKRADALCDLYSLGATLYMAVTGVLPFRTQSVRAIATMCKKKITNDLAAPYRLVPEVSEHLSLMILKAVRANRRERFGSVQEFIDAVMAAPATTGTAAPAVMPGLRTESLLARERRNRKRINSRRDTNCHPVERTPVDPWQAQVVNISEGGMCLELCRRFEPGALLTVVLEGKETRRQSLVVQVRWVKQLSLKRWQMGCRHDQPLNDFEVSDLAS